MDKEDTSHQEDVASYHTDKSRSSGDESKQDTPKAVSKDEGDYEDEKEERRQEQAEQQASYSRHRNPLARFKAQYPEPLAEFLTVSEKLQVFAHCNLFLTHITDNSNCFPLALRESQL